MKKVIDHEIPKMLHNLDSSGLSLCKFPCSMERRHRANKIANRVEERIDVFSWLLLDRLWWLLFFGNWDSLWSENEAPTVVE